MTQALKKIPFKVWFFVFALGVFVISIVQLPAVGAYDQSEVDSLSERYDREHVVLRRAVTKYHNDMNDLMNDFTEKLIDGEDSNPPSCDGEACQPKEMEAACTDGNVSTFCLSVKMVNNYLAFQQALYSDDENSHSQYSYDKIEHFESYRNSIENSDLLKALDVWNISDGEYEAVAFEGLIKSRNQRIALIEDQKDLAKDVMDVALATYNQLLMYYKLHVAYEGVIEDLEEYRDALSDVRFQVEKYPSKFHNVTTTECT
jgi:hypothetical protein